MPGRQRSFLHYSFGMLGKQLGVESSFSGQISLKILDSTSYIQPEGTLIFFEDGPKKYGGWAKKIHRGVLGYGK